MKLNDHIMISLDAILKKRSDFYFEHKEEVDKIIHELHTWMDQYSDKKGEGYDYAVGRVIRHREWLYHIQGIRMAADHFAGVYGEMYRVLVLEEAERHG